MTEACDIGCMLNESVTSDFCFTCECYREGGAESAVFGAALGMDGHFAGKKV